MNELTEKQAIAHRYLCDRWADPPTVRELMEFLGVSINSANGHLKALARKGYIELPDGKRSRGIRLLIGPDLHGDEIEIAGRIYRLINTGKETDASSKPTR